MKLIQQKLKTFVTLIPLILYWLLNDILPATTVACSFIHREKGSGIVCCRDRIVLVVVAE